MTSLRALTTAAVVVMLAGFAGAIVDYRVTLSGVPPEPAECSPYTEACALVQERREERRRAAEADFRDRSWFYGLAVLGGALGLTGVSLLGRRAPSERQRIFANLGVGGVLLALVVAALFWLANTLTIEPAVDSAFVPSMVMLAVAAVGGMNARARSGRSLAVEGRRCRLVWHVSLAGLGLTAVTFLLAWIATEQLPTCSGGSVIDYLFWAAVATSIAAGLFALLGLLVRRWFLALVCFVVNPVLLLAFVFSCLEA